MSRTVNIGCVGDSLTQGGYPRVLQDLLSGREPSCKWNLHNMGVLGAESKEWADSILPSRSHNPSGMAIDLYLVMLGTNDAQQGHWQANSFLTGSAEQAFSARLSQIGKALLAEGAAVMFISPPPVAPGGILSQNFDASILNSVIPRIVPQVAASIGCGYADAFSALGGLQPKREAFLDGVHLSPEGNKLVANAIVNQVHQTVMGRAGGNALPGQNLLAPAPGMLPPSHSFALNANTHSFAPFPSSQTQVGLAPSVSPVGTQLFSQMGNSVSVPVASQGFPQCNSFSVPGWMSATPRLSQPQANEGFEDGFYTGVPASIYSNSWGGFVQKGVVVREEFGKTKPNAFQPPSQRLINGGSPLLQATPICTSNARSTSFCTSQVGGIAGSSILRANPVNGGFVGSLATPVKATMGPVSPMNGAAMGVVLNAATGLKRSSMQPPILSAASFPKSQSFTTSIMGGQPGLMLPSANSFYKRHCGYTGSAVVSVR